MSNQWNENCQFTCWKLVHPPSMEENSATFTVLRIPIIPFSRPGHERTSRKVYSTSFLSGTSSRTLSMWPEYIFQPDLAPPAFQDIVPSSDRTIDLSSRVMRNTLPWTISISATMKLLETRHVLDHPYREPNF